MYPSLPPSRIRPKISSMPRKKSEATACLDVYKLVVEKKRLQQELEKIEQRRSLIQTRLAQLNNQIGELEENIQQIRGDESIPGQENPQRSHVSGEFSSSGNSPLGNYETLLLDY